MVHPVIAGDQGGTEGAGGIYGGAGEGESDENVHGDGQADGEARDFVECAFDVNGRGEENEDQKKREHAFQNHGVESREIGRERGVDRAEGFRAPVGIGDDEGEKVGGGDGAEKLRDGVKQRLYGAEPAGDPEADGDGGIEMSTGNVPERSDHDGNGEAVGEREAKEGDAALSGGAEILVGADYAGGEEDLQRKCRRIQRAIFG